jgi:hypothetical protein
VVIVAVCVGGRETFLVQLCLKGGFAAHIYEQYEGFTGK